MKDALDMYDLKKKAELGELGDILAMAKKMKLDKMKAKKKPAAMAVEVSTVEPVEGEAKEEGAEMSPEDQAKLMELYGKYC